MIQDYDRGDGVFVDAEIQKIRRELFKVQNCGRREDVSTMNEARKTMAKELDEQILAFRAARSAAFAAIKEAFPIGATVRMKTGAVATVHAHRFDNPDLVDLLFENGNVWTKSYHIIELV